MLSNRNLIDNAFSSTDNDHPENQVFLNILPIHHVFCINCDVLVSLRYGNILCLNRDMSRLADICSFSSPRHSVQYRWWRRRFITVSVFSGSRIRTRAWKRQRRRYSEDVCAEYPAVEISHSGTGKELSGAGHFHRAGLRHVRVFACHLDCSVGPPG